MILLRVRRLAHRILKRQAPIPARLDWQSLTCLNAEERSSFIYLLLVGADLDGKNDMNAQTLTHLSICKECRGECEKEFADAIHAVSMVLDNAEPGHIGLRLSYCLDGQRPEYLRWFAIRHYAARTAAEEPLDPTVGALVEKNLGLVEADPTLVFQAEPSDSYAN